LRHDVEELVGELVGVAEPEVDRQGSLLSDEHPVPVFGASALWQGFAAADEDEQKAQSVAERVAGSSGLTAASPFRRRWHALALLRKGFTGG
jgi:hypothetical protein